MSTKILMIDDLPDIFDTIRNYAPSYGFSLCYSTNLEDGLTKLTDEKEILGVILDGRGFINRDQRIGEEQDDFLTRALLDLNNFERFGRRIPKIVLTAYYDQFEPLHRTIVKVYDKLKINDSDYLNTMFSYLSKEIDKNPEFRIREKYINIFNAVNNFDNDNKNKLFELLKDIEIEKLDNNNFNSARIILESFFIALKKHDNNSLPGHLFRDNGKPILGYCADYLCDYHYNRVPEHIKVCIKFVLNTTNIYSHPYNNNTIYIFRSVVFALSEILIWFKRYQLSNP